MELSVNPEEYVVSVVSLIGMYLEERLITRGNPVDNSGAEYENDVFYIGAFDWDEDKEEYLPNFWYKPSNYQMEWYKHIGRGTFANRAMPFDEAYEILKHCIDSVNTITAIPPANEFYWEEEPPDDNG